MRFCFAAFHVHAAFRSDEDTKKCFWTNRVFYSRTIFLNPEGTLQAEFFFFSYTVRYGVKVGLKIVLYHGLQHEQWREFVMIDHIRYDTMDRIDNQN